MNPADNLTCNELETAESLLIKTLSCSPALVSLLPPFRPLPLSVGRDRCCFCDVIQAILCRDLANFVT
eukprot:124522-Rhodomonas_salina.1